MSINSNDNIRKIAKLTTRELPQKSKNAKITVRENNGLYSITILVAHIGLHSFDGYVISVYFYNVLAVYVIMCCQDLGPFHKEKMSMIATLLGWPFP